MTSLPTQSQDLRDIPRLIANRYELLSELGAGGMGVVYKARDSLLKNLVAIKMLNTSNLSPELFLRFQLEAKAAGNLAHPNIVTIYTFGMDDDLPYMIMEYVEGTSLSAYLEQNGPMTPEEAMPIFTQICDGMTHAHRKGIVHRDLKTSNILLSFPGAGPPKVHILDFGIAKIETEEGKVTRTGQILGSPRYMSPEQFSGRKLDVRSDVYSMGCIMFETLTGRAPFESDNILTLKQLHETAPIPDPEEVCPSGTFSPSLKSVLRKALAKTPASRYQRMALLKVALLSALNNPDETVGAFRLVMQSFTAASRRPLIATAMIVALLGVPLLMWKMSDVPADKAPPVSIDAIKHYASDGHEHYWFPSNTHPNEDKTARLVKPDQYGILDLAGSTVTDSVLDSVPSDLKGLYLDGTQITDSGLAKVSKRCIGLTKVHLLACENVTDKAIDALVTLGELEELGISTPRMTPEGIKKLAALKAVKYLNLEGNQAVTDEGLAHLSRMKSLAFLNLLGTRVTAKGISALETLHLRSLNLSVLNLKDQDLRHLKNLHVYSLDLGQNPLTGKCFEYLKEFRYVDIVNLKRTPNISVEQIEDFEKHSRITIKREEM